MKKIFNILLGVVGMFAIVACSDDTENPYAHDSLINIVESNVRFMPRESSGVIRFQAAGDVTVTSNSQWCKAVLDADSVKVTVDQNITVNGRSTTIVLRCGADSTVVPVTQLGVVLQLGDAGIASETDNASFAYISYRTNVDLEIVSSPDWATASLAGDSLCVDFAANTTGHLRSGYIKLKSDGFEDSVKVVQADFDKDVAGTYKLYYTDDRGKLRSMNAVLSSTAIQLTNMGGLKIPVTYDPATASLSIESAQYVGSYSGSSIYTVLMSAFEEYTSFYNAEYYITAEIVYNAENGETLTFGGQFDAYHPIDILRLDKFTEQNMSSGYADGTLINFNSPYLNRAPSSSAKNFIIR